MTSKSELVPIKPRVADLRPNWRRRIEGVTQLAVGLGAELLGASRRDDGVQQMAEDTALGLLLGGERLVLDGAERVIDAATAAVRLGERLPPAAGVARWARRRVEPIRQRGSTERTRAQSELRAQLPDYVDRAVQAAFDLVSVNDVLDRIDVNGILERVNVNRVVERVDVQALIDRVDLNALMSRIDLDALVERTDLGAVIAQSTGGVTSGAVDLVRRQGVGLDQFVARWAVRVRRSRLRTAPLGPELLVAPKSLLEADAEVES